MHCSKNGYGGWEEEKSAHLGIVAGLGQTFEVCMADSCHRNPSVVYLAYGWRKEVLEFFDGVRSPFWADVWGLMIRL